MRKIESHQGTALNEALDVQVLDSPGPGGACHHYKIHPKELDTFDACTDPTRASRLMRACCDIRFQDGSPQEVGVNGVSNEALLAIVHDRLTGFDQGPFACPETDLANRLVHAALEVLKSRTARRTSEGTEGVLSESVVTWDVSVRREGNRVVLQTSGVAQDLAKVISEAMA